MSFGWKITEDLLHKNDPELFPEEDGIVNEYRVSNDSDDNKSKELMEALDAGKGYVFKLIDDDGLPHWKGRFYDDSGEYDEESLYELFKWGSNYSGTTFLTFPGKKGWDIG